MTKTSTPDRIRIRRAEREDASALIRLITALAEFEHLAPPDDAAQARLIEDGFGAQPRYEAWLAETTAPASDGPVGYAFLLSTYSTFLARPTLFLEDLFVLPEFRNQGIGGALLRHCMALASERGCGRMEWTCLDWNTNAQAVYEKFGAERLSEWYLYRMTQDALANVVYAPKTESVS